MVCAPAARANRTNRPGERGVGRREVSGGGGAGGGGFGRGPTAHGPTDPQTPKVLEHELKMTDDTSQNGLRKDDTGTRNRATRAHGNASGHSRGQC